MKKKTIAYLILWAVLLVYWMVLGANAFTFGSIAFYGVIGSVIILIIPTRKPKQKGE